MICSSSTERIKEKNFTYKEIISLSKIRIIKKNLVHAHGFPSNLANIEKLSQVEYFGQYGNIKKILLSSKTNTGTNKKTFSIYVTYSNEVEASLAILAVDSLLIEGKLIRAFFGTTKYCNYFLNNNRCPNEEKCMFLHKLVEDKDIIIDSDTVFSYNEHLNLAKKIINFSNPETRKNFIKLVKPKNTVFPNIDFIFLNEDQKEHYLKSKGISYIKSDTNKRQNNSNYNYNNTFIEDNNQSNLIYDYSLDSNNNINLIKGFAKNNSIGNLSINNFHNNDQIKDINILTDKEKSHKNKNLDDPFEMYKIFKNPIKRILSAKSLFTKNFDKKILNKMEFNYLKNELNKNGINIYNLLYGCLDSISDIDDEN